MNIEEIMSALTYDKFIVFDTESTGLQPNNTYSKLLEIGALKVEKNIIVDRFDMIINPGCTVPSKIEKMTGISEEKALSGENCYVALRKFKEWCEGDYVFIGHNIQHDLTFLNFFAKQCGIEFNNPDIDTQKLAKKILDIKTWNSINKNLNRNMKLETLAHLFNVDDKNHHRADNDAEVTWHVYENLKKLAYKADPNLVYRQWKYPQVKNVLEPKDVFIYSISPWDKGKRLYVELKVKENSQEGFSTVFYDFNYKTWGIKNITFPINFEKLESFIEDVYRNKLIEYENFRSRKYFTDRLL